MSTRRLLATTAVALALAAAAPLAARAASQGTPAAARNRSPVTLRQTVVLPWQRLWATVLGLDAGCHIDPSGQACAATRETSALDNGCHIDPSGRCLDVPAALPPGGLDAGCHLDPDGCQH